MEKLINPYDKEYMKMAMLKHEEIFREQVYELHRLYQTQKLLMKNMSSSQLQQARNDQYQHYLYVDKRDIKNATNALNGQYFDSNKKIKTPRQCFDLEIRPNDKGCNVNAESGVDIEDETELELTLGLSSYKAGRRRKITSDSASSSTGSTGQIKHKTNLASTGHKWGLENLPVSNPSFQLIGGRVQNNPNVEEQFRSQDSSMNNPPWLFQVLSLNMT